MAHAPASYSAVLIAVDRETGIGQSRCLTATEGSENSAEAILVEAARGGDRDAFGRLYSLYARMVHGIVLARVPPAEVEDLVQEVFLSVLRRLHSLRDTARFGAWLAMIARNKAYDYHRSFQQTEDLPQELAGEISTEPEAAAVLRVIRRLPEAYRETLLLRLVEGMSGPEIAARTGLTPASVRVNLHRGMKQLREKLGKGEARE